MEAALRAPGSIDWRNHNGNWITSIKDQLSCGSCVSFATCATIEARANIVCNNAGLALDLSENHLFFCGCGNCCRPGWYFDQALTFAQNTGVALDAESPYTPVDKPCPQVPPKVKIKGWRAVYSVADRKASLSARGPMVVGMRVYDDFYHYQSGVYHHVTGALAAAWRCSPSSHIRPAPFPYGSC